MAGVLALLLALIPIAMDRASAEAPDSDSDSVTLETFPSTATATLHQVDPADIPAGQILSKVTLTATVEGSVEGTLTNLSTSQSKDLGSSVAAGITVNGPEVSDLTAEGTDAFAVTLGPGETAPVSLLGTDTVTTEIIDLAQLEAFKGTGTLDYEVSGLVETSVTGPAPYRSNGAGGGTATVEIFYEFADELITPEPAISIEKTNDADGDEAFTDEETAPTESATVPFHIVITNTGNVPLTLTSLQDAFTGSDLNLFTSGCEALDGANLPTGGSLECTFDVADYAPAPGESLVNIVEVKAEDEDGTEVTSDDLSTVNVDEIPADPAISIVKDNDANGDGDFTDEESAPEEGADVPFRIVITNTGNVPLTLTSLQDAFTGSDLNLFTNGCEALDGANLPTGESLECTFDVADYAPAPGKSLVNTVEVTGEDEEGTEVSADDPSTVNVAADPAISIVKDNDANVDGTFTDSETAPSEGAAVDFKIVITNTGNVPLTLTSLEDDFDGTTVDLLASGCETVDDAPLAVGASVECTFTLPDYAPAPGSLLNTVTVIGTDGSTDVTDDDPSTVIVDEPPCIEPNTEIKFEGGALSEGNSTPTEGPSGIVTIDNFTFKEGSSEITSLDWTSTEPIHSTVLKAGKDDPDVTTEVNGATSGTLTVSGQNAISHVSFLLCLEE